MREAWRWFGEADPVTLNDIRQAGATDVVCALYHIAPGEPWPEHEIRALKDRIESAPSGTAPLRWRVVESLPVHEHIKLGRPDRDEFIDIWIETLVCLARHGLEVMCYNFMPVIDWTRTDLRHPLPSGAYTLRFDQRACAVFDLHILKRSDAPKDYTTKEREQAARDYARMSEEQAETLVRTVIAGLPGRSTIEHDLTSFKRALRQYRRVDRRALERHLAYFVGRVAPHAERAGIRLAIHPDDPPWSLFGLPRVVCNAEDIGRLLEACPSPSNGLALCAGTLGSSAHNDVPEIARRFGTRVYFSHLRNVRRDEDEPRSFVESGHLDGDVDLIGVIKALLRHERGEHPADARDIYIRPDHGHEMMGDIGKSNNPGYSAIGRLKGLAEVRGVMRALQSRPCADK